MTNFNKQRCDWNYASSCCADTDCSAYCDMPCPYVKNVSPCIGCELNKEACYGCEAKTIHEKQSK